MSEHAITSRATNFYHSHDAGSPQLVHFACPFLPLEGYSRFERCRSLRHRRPQARPQAIVTEGFQCHVSQQNWSRVTSFIIPFLDIVRNDSGDVVRQEHAAGHNRHAKIKHGVIGSVK